MSTPKSAKAWILDAYPKDAIKISGPDAHIRLQESALTTPVPSGHVLLRTIFFSNDPVQRHWIDSNPPTTLLPFRSGPGKPVPCFAVSEVVESNDAALQKGDHVVAPSGWVTHTIFPAAMCEKVPEPPNGLSYSHYVGTLGLTGLTAYIGMMETVKATPEDIVVVSGAAGATGSVAVQIAKHVIGCKRVIGLAGTPEKCEWVESIGADVCYNYKETGLEEKLRAEKEAPTVYFDNVGGKMLQLMIYVMNNHGRIASCGSISDYNQSQEEKQGITNYFWLCMKSLKMSGFTLFDLKEDPNKVRALFLDKLAKGQFHMGDETQMVVDATIEDVPAVWTKLFDGVNTGKLITKLVT